MTRLGYTLSSEENGASALVAQATRAEEAGFEFASISDHFHPWIDRQGESPFVRAVLGAISQHTERLRLITGVTCPTTRLRREPQRSHPRRPLATGGRAPGPAQGGDRGDPRASWRRAAATA